MSSIERSTILITGGASGIGRLLGSSFIDKGCTTLILWDVNETMLNETIREFSSRLNNVKGYVVDVSDPGQILSAAERTLREAGPVDILINNAGIIVGKYFHEHSHAEIGRTMAVNADALMHVAREFLPGMIERKKGHIVNISSAAGMVGNPVIVSEVLNNSFPYPYGLGGGGVGRYLAEPAGAGSRLPGRFCC